MVKTMADLRNEVATRLRNALHGREIDTMKNDVRLPHMLGITPVGKVHDAQNEEMTLLDPRHPFWDDFEENINTRGNAREKVKTAVHLLTENGVLEKTYPYGEDADITYIEVEDVTRQEPGLATTCKRCDAVIDGDLSLDLNGRSYSLNVLLDCPECDYSRIVGTGMVPQ